MTALWGVAWALWWGPALWWCELVLRAEEPAPSADIIDMAQWVREHHRAHPHGGHAA